MCEWCADKTENIMCYVLWFFGVVSVYYSFHFHVLSRKECDLLVYNATSSSSSFNDILVVNIVCGCLVVYFDAISI